MIKTEIVGGGSNKAAQVADTPFGNVLTTITPDKLYAHFKSATRAAAGTTIIVQPRSGEAIALTDFIISGEKKAGTLTLQFTDGTNTINIAVIPLVDAPANFAIPFVGRWMGWRDARISMITDIEANVTVSCGYIRVPSGHTLSYAEWDALR